jgi:hypothetical protein
MGVVNDGEASAEVLGSLTAEWNNKNRGAKKEELQQYLASKGMKFKRMNFSTDKLVYWNENGEKATTSLESMIDQMLAEKSVEQSAKNMENTPGLIAAVKAGVIQGNAASGDTITNAFKEANGGAMTKAQKDEYKNITKDTWKNTWTKLSDE